MRRCRRSGLSLEVLVVYLGYRIDSVLDPFLLLVRCLRLLR